MKFFKILLEIIIVFTFIGCSQVTSNSVHTESDDIKIKDSTLPEWVTNPFQDNIIGAVGSAKLKDGLSPKAQYFIALTNAECQISEIYSTLVSSICLTKKIKYTDLSQNIVEKYRTRVDCSSVQRSSGSFITYIERKWTHPENKTLYLWLRVKEP